MQDASENPAKTIDTKAISLDLAHKLISGPFPGKRKDNLFDHYGVDQPVSDASLKEAIDTVAGVIKMALGLPEIKGPADDEAVQEKAMQTVEKAVRDLSANSEKRLSSEHVVEYLGGLKRSNIKQLLPDNSIGKLGVKPTARPTQRTRVVHKPEDRAKYTGATTSDGDSTPPAGGGVGGFGGR
jgi:hypothetical protein